MDLRNLILVVAVLALEGVLLEPRDRCHQSADVADLRLNMLAEISTDACTQGRRETKKELTMDSKRIADIEQPLLQETRRPMSNHAITFHLPETKATISRTTLHRLASQDLRWAAGASVDLVVNHMAQTLVVSRAEEDLGYELAPGVPVVHDFEATGLVALAAENTGYLCDGDFGEWGCVTFVAS
jgi:hypothetical protein